MDKLNKDVVFSKIRGYFKVVNHLSELISTDSKSDSVMYEKLREDIKADKPFEEVEEDIKTLRIKSDESFYKMKDRDAMIYKISVMINVLTDLGISIDDIGLSKEDKEAVGEVISQTSDSDLFAYGLVDDEVKVINGEVMNDLRTKLKELLDSEDYAKKQYDNLKAILTKNNV